jgi:quercetin 2,3-dioxygenase
LIENKHQAIKQQCIEINAAGADLITIENTGSEILECIIVSGTPHNKPFCKLLGHGGALVGPDKATVATAMQEYEADPENFGKV